MSDRSRDQLLVALLFVGRYLMEAALPAISEEGRSLTAADVAFLFAVRVFPASSQKEIASVLGRDKTTLSRLVARLEKTGFVDARIDPMDGRRRTLVLTDKALSAAQPAFEALSYRLETVASRLTPEEEMACFRLIDLLADELSVV